MKAWIFRTDQQRPAKIILNDKPEGRKIKRRPKLRLDDGVNNDIEALDEINGGNKRSQE
jgi:hypothetical protein